MKRLLPFVLLSLVVSCSQTARKDADLQFQPLDAAALQGEPETPAQVADVEPAGSGAFQTNVLVPPPVAQTEAVRTAEPAAAAAEQGTPVVTPAQTPAQPVLPAEQPVTIPGQPATTPATPPTGVPAPLPQGAGSSAAADVEEVLPAGEIDFRNMPLEQVLEVYADLVNRTLIRPPNLPQAQVTLRTQTPLTRQEAIQALDSVLALSGIAMINRGEKFVTVLPQQEVHTGGARPDPRGADELPEFGQFVTHIEQLEYIKPSEAAQVLQQFARIPNSVLPIDSSQMIVLRDYAENVARMLEMLEKIDQAVPTPLVSEVIPIKYAKAVDMAEALGSLGSGGTTATIGTQRSSVGGQRMGGRYPAGRSGTTGGYYNQGGYNQPYVPMATGGGTAATASAAAGDSFQNRLRRIIERASDQGELQILGETKILADERSNSLLVFATRQDMEMIKTIIAKLDIVLPQVLIETIIMDVQLDDSWLFGVSAGQHRQGEAGSAEVGGASNNENNLLGNLADFFSGGGTNTFPTSAGLTYFGRFNGDFDLAVQAAATDSRINVIQKPRILTSHATPGRIFVGSTVPYVTGTYYGGGFGGPSSSYQQLRVGIGLEVVPFINPDGLVVMEIYETIEEVSGSTAITGVGNVPNTTTREFAANVAVRDGDSVMLGGFIRNSTNKDVSGVPILKDIPLLGALFSSRSSSKSRKELIVLMRPTVLKTPEIAALASAAEKDRLPGVTRADAEVQEFERKEFDRQQEEIRSRQQQEQRKRR